MDKALESYLNTIDKNLKPLPVSERVDIVKEIKSSILEMQSEGLTTEKILEKLGEPKELSKAYLEDLISNGNRGSFARFLTVFAFYSLTGFSGMFIIPMLGTIAPIFIITGTITPFLGLVKFIGYLLHFDVPWVIFQIGSYIPHPALAFLYSIIIGIILVVSGRGLWKLLIHYIKGVGRKKRDLLI